MRFSVTWASATPAYAGMIVGVWLFIGQFTPGQMLLGIMGGMFFGGAIALPLVLSNLVAALVAKWLTRGQSFGSTFRAFAALSAVAAFFTIRWLSDLIGEPDMGLESWSALILVWAASLGLGFAFMALGLKPRGAWSD
jgi:hypothetical protein